MSSVKTEIDLKAAELHEKMQQSNAQMTAMFSKMGYDDKKLKEAFNQFKKKNGDPTQIFAEKPFSAY